MDYLLEVGVTRHRLEAGTKLTAVHIPNLTATATDDPVLWVERRTDLGDRLAIGNLSSENWRITQPSGETFLLSPGGASTRLVPNMTIMFGNSVGIIKDASVIPAGAVPAVSSLTPSPRPPIGHLRHAPESGYDPIVPPLVREHRTRSSGWLGWGAAAAALAGAVLVNQDQLSRVMHSWVGDGCPGTHCDAAVPVPTQIHPSPPGMAETTNSTPVAPKPSVPALPLAPTRPLPSAIVFKPGSSPITVPPASLGSSKPDGSPSESTPMPLQTPPAGAPPQSGIAIAAAPTVPPLPLTIVEHQSSHLAPSASTTMRTPLTATSITKAKFAASTQHMLTVAPQLPRHLLNPRRAQPVQARQTPPQTEGKGITQAEHVLTPPTFGNQQPHGSSVQLGQPTLRLPVAAQSSPAVPPIYRAPLVVPNMGNRQLPFMSQVFHSFNAPIPNFRPNPPVPTTCPPGHARIANGCR